jgi:hypothetical protein
MVFLLKSNSDVCVSLQFRLELKKEDKEKLIQLMRKQSSGGVEKTILQSAWRVLKVALLLPILGKVLRRDLSPLKPLLVEGVWDRDFYQEIFGFLELLTRVIK